MRLEARDPAPTGDAGRRGTVRYTVSDGTQRTTGEIEVLQQGALADPLPLVQDDEAVVREGDTVSIPVLDNDTMADGIPLRLDPSSVKVITKGAAQRAFASGNVIRYVPEATGLTADRFVTIEYAAYADGMKERAQTARARVQVTPLPSAQRIDQAPVARSFTATVTAGDPLTMTVPTFGVDPDGDSVTVTGVVGPGRQGRRPHLRPRRRHRPHDHPLRGLPAGRGHRGHHLRGHRPLRGHLARLGAGRGRPARRPAAPGRRARRGVRGAGEDGHGQAAGQRPHRPR